MDREVHVERVLLARTLDILAGAPDAETRLAGLLDLLARTVRATRAAVLADGVERRVAVGVAEGEDRTDAEALAAWLDVSAPRSRADRAASAPASVSLLLRPDDAPRRRPASEHHYAFIEMPNAGSVALGFDFGDPALASELANRLPPGLARHAAAAVALVTDQLAGERELAELRARDQERSRYVSTVAHELRTPLTGLAGYLDLVLAGRVEDVDVQRDFLERCQTIVDSMAELVSDLLEQSRLESGTLALDVAPFSLAEAGGRVVSGLLPIAMERGIELRSELPPRLRAATGDRRRVEQILTNLVGNGLKFTQAGGVVELAGRFDGPVAVFAVRDDGSGIGYEDRVRVFERFVRLDAHEPITGTGLGLPIARDLARAMGGDLDLASLEGAGTTFVLALPGPAPIDGETVAAALGRALAAEEVRLHERTMLRALGSLGRREDPRRDERRREDGEPGPFEIVAPRRVVPRFAGSRPVHLRAIDGSLERDPAPA